MHPNQATLSGFGLGLRQPHYAMAARGEIKADWFEIVSENFMEAHPGHLELLRDVRAHYPIVMHGVALNIGGTEPLDRHYLGKLKTLAEAVRPAWISDHLCWTGAGGAHSHDLLPVPYTQEALNHIVARVMQVQDVLGCPLALENPSTYVEFSASAMPEWEFMAALVAKVDCALLLDINNIHVSAFNHGWNATRYIDALPADRIAYMHLAGHRNLGTHLIDTHDDHVSAEVWELYRYAVMRLGACPTMVEWDAAIPPLEVLIADLDKARAIGESVLRKAAS